MTVELIGLRGRSAANTKGVRTYTRVALFRTSSQDDDEYDVGSHPSVPLIGSVHPSDSGAWCTQLTVENTNFWAGWTVTAQYSSENELAENPVFEPATFDWDGEQFESVAMIDRNGDAVCNSAGDIFTDPPAMKDDSRPICTVTKNLAVVPTYILTYQDAVNSTAFTLDGLTIGAGLAKMNRVSVSRKQLRNGYTFRVVTFDIHLQRTGWAIKPIDVGFRKKSGTDRMGITNDDGTEPKVKVFLNGSGAVIADPEAADVVSLSFDVYDAQDFNALPLT